MAVVFGMPEVCGEDNQDNYRITNQDCERFVFCGTIYVSRIQIITAGKTKVSSWPHGPVSLSLE